MGASATSLPSVSNPALKSSVLLSSHAPWEEWHRPLQRAGKTNLCPQGVGQCCAERTQANAEEGPIEEELDRHEGRLDLEGVEAGRAVPAGDEAGTRALRGVEDEG